MVRHFGHAARLLPQTSIDHVFREVEACHADFAVVPIENSTEGVIGRTLDLMMTTPLRICGEVVLRIHQNLLTNETSLGKINKVYSHAQSLAQCHEWLNRSLPHAQRISVGSNAQAAQMTAAEEGAAAIAGEAASERYLLPKLVSNIEDEPNNTTRFVVLGRQESGRSGRDKTSLIMSAHNRTGALTTLLASFSDAGVSMTRLESRPARHTLWEYVFFVDIEGHLEYHAVAAALAELAQRAPYLKVLGSYPSRLTDFSLSNVRAISPYMPGKPITQLAREIGLPIESIVKLASNENPLGMSPRDRVAMERAVGSLERYPDHFNLKKALANDTGLGMERIVLGNGSNDVLDLIARVFLAPGRSAIFSHHAFAVYPLASLAAGAE